MRFVRHSQAKRRLEPYTDAELDSRWTERIRYHLDECPDCAAHVRLMLAVKASLRATGDVALDRAAVERLRHWADDI